VLYFLETFTLTFALALFLGGGAYWAFVAAPAVFAVSPGPKVAGQLAAAMSGRFDRIAQACLLAIGGIELLRVTERATPAEVLRVALAATMTALALYTIWVVRPELRKQQDLDLDAMGSDHPHRRRFRKLQGQAYLATLGQLLAAAFLLALILMDR
jgi:hypothetical protein